MKIRICRDSEYAHIKRGHVTKKPMAITIETMTGLGTAPWCSGKCIRHGSVGRWFEARPGHTKDLNNGTTATLG